MRIDLICYILFIAFFYFLPCLAQVQESRSMERICEEEFRDPPPSARPGAFWCWLNGNMYTASITRDLEEMKSKGDKKG